MDDRDRRVAVATLCWAAAWLGSRELAALARQVAERHPRVADLAYRIKAAGIKAAGEARGWSP